MVDKPKNLEKGDACPNCGGEIVPVNGAEVKDKTELHRCASCGYLTRFPVSKAKAAKDKDSES